MPTISLQQAETHYCILCGKKFLSTFLITLEADEGLQYICLSCAQPFMPKEGEVKCGCTQKK